MSRCKSCGKEIIWIKMESGKNMPVDEGLVPYKRDPKGPDTVITQYGEAIRCFLQFEGKPTGLARISHFATCPNAAMHRKPRKEE